jgi:molybdate transport system ATP-binding protein
MSWLTTVGAADLASRRPGELSGGQAQRVAIARALAAGPEVLVLDEPLAGLDVAGAASVRGVLHRVMTAGGRPAILITHDLLDVLALADRVLVLENGRIAELGPVRSVLATPRSGFAARIAGINLVSGVLSDTGAVLSASGRSWHGLPADTADGAPTDGRDADLRTAAGQAAVAVFPPSAVAVFRHRPYGSPRNCVEVRVSALEVNGASVRVRGEDQPDGAPGLAADITPEAAADLRLEVGEQVWLTVKAHEVRVHSTQQRGTHASGEPAGRHG